MSKIPNINFINYNSTTYAIILRSDYKSNDIAFFTPKNYSQQLGYMNRKKGYVIPPHIHKITKREILLTQETLFIKSGKVKVNFYTEDKIFFDSLVLSAGDVLLLARGGHGFEMLEDTEIIEVKQGPYNDDMDKERF
ncbi:hypothetical protein FIT70_04290 [Candidatus Methylopumilus universalis]|jgi:hypothetical protein|uniref:hypothetical protein n=1 Tax=Candidatus Methylopumilus universalis TaxID=2588536 RepID=UPI001124101A|nr:hypothetical protein [Candidatus Methylopumilus universalis]QDC99131.1 hypothetical protein FIT70_04290 [Candidatus Methylopumilus universalis]